MARLIKNGLALGGSKITGLANGALPTDLATVSQLSIAVAPVSPSANALLAWFEDVIFCNAGSGVGGGQLILLKVMIPQTITVSNIVYYVTTAGQVLTSGGNWVGLYSSAGVKLAGSADQTASFGSTGPFIAPVTPVVVTGGPGAFVYVGVLANATLAAPGFASSSQLTAAVLNIGTSAAAGNLRVGLASGSYSVLPATIDPKAATPGVWAFWVALS